MLIVTAKVPRRKLALGVAAAALLCCCVVAVTAVILSAGGMAVTASAEVRGIRDNDDRVAYLNELGWTVSAEPIATEELLIPDEFDDTYSDYLNIFIFIAVSLCNKKNLIVLILGKGDALFFQYPYVVAVVSACHMTYYHY